MAKEQILIACEYSGIVRDAFIEQGFNAISCDILPSDSNKGKHVQGDVIKLLEQQWNAIIAFPPCTHLAISGASHFAKKREDGRQKEAIEFFFKLWNVKCDYIAIENPVNIIGGKYIEKHFPYLVKKYGNPKPTQYIQPYQFGDSVTKKTGLWLKGFPKLQKTNVVEGSKYITAPSGRKYPEWQWYTGGGYGHKRSIFFKGIANAMADQWGNYLKNKKTPLEEIIEF